MRNRIYAWITILISAAITFAVGTSIPLQADDPFGSASLIFVFSLFAGIALYLLLLVVLYIVLRIFYETDNHCESGSVIIKSLHDYLFWLIMFNNEGTTLCDESSMIKKSNTFILFMFGFLFGLLVLGTTTISSDFTVVSTTIKNDIAEIKIEKGTKGYYVTVVDNNKKKLIKILGFDQKEKVDMLTEAPCQCHIERFYKKIPFFENAMIDWDIVCPEEKETILDVKCLKVSPSGT